MNNKPHHRYFIYVLQNRTEQLYANTLDDDFEFPSVIAKYIDSNNWLTYQTNVIRLEDRIHIPTFEKLKELVVLTQLGVTGEDLLEYL